MGVNDRQRKFADAILNGETQLEAYEIAGYNAEKKSTKRSYASQLLRNEDVKAYMDEQREDAARVTKSALSSLGRKVVNTFINILDSEGEIPQAKEKIKVCESILDRIGVEPGKKLAQDINQEISGNLSVKDLHKINEDLLSNGESD